MSVGTYCLKNFGTYELNQILVRLFNPTPWRHSLWSPGFAKATLQRNSVKVTRMSEMLGSARVHVQSRGNDRSVMWKAVRSSSVRGSCED